MGQADLRLTGGEVLLSGSGLCEADVLIKGGRISALVARGADGVAVENYPIPGLTILPGAIDAHLHLGHGMDISRPRVPGDAASETAAAAKGGITCFLPYVMSADPYLPELEDLRRVIEAGARIDFGLHFVIATLDQLAELPDLIRAGVPTAKLFMNIRGDEGARLGLPGVDDGFLFRLLEVLAAHGGMLCPHPENIEVAWVLRDRVMDADAAGDNGLVSWDQTRPPFVEAAALQTACYLGRITGTPIHAVHTSSGEALAAAVLQREAGADVSIETCVHYLTHDTASDLGTIGKVNPPLRSPEDRDALWQGVRDGQIDIIGTDHIHRPLSAKDGGIWKAQPGFPGLDTFVPALISEGVKRRRIPLQRIVNMISENPARRMGLWPRKGVISPGADADLAIVDMNATWRVERADLSSDAGYSIFEGQELDCRVVHTLSRGRFVLQDGVVQPESLGTGMFIARSLVGG